MKLRNNGRRWVCRRNHRTSPTVWYLAAVAYLGSSSSCSNTGLATVACRGNSSYSNTGPAVVACLDSSSSCSNTGLATVVCRGNRSTSNTGLAVVACRGSSSNSNNGLASVVVVVVVVFTLTDRASTIPSNIRGCQSGTWSQRGTKVNGSHHGDNPLLRPTGIQIATKR